MTYCIDETNGGDLYQTCRTRNEKRGQLNGIKLSFSSF